jgi:drug/metabolite transporter (DMT)-like permease
MFAIGFIITLPITFTEFREIQWGQLPLETLGAIAFVVIGTTFLTYLFNVFALTQLKASTVGVFMYLQPLIGIIFAIVAGKDHLTLVKFLAIAFVLIGVYLVSKKVRPGP